MDKLKKYFKDNEVFMEVEMPDEKSIWDRIESGSTKKLAKKNRMLTVMRYAAAACIIIVMGLLVILKAKEKNATGLAAIKDKLPVMIDTTIDMIPSPVITKTTETKKTQNLTTTQKKYENILSEDEADKIVKSYKKLINFQLKQLRTTAVYAGNPDYFTGLVQHFKQMQKDEQALIYDMGQYGLTDELLEELITINLRKLNALKTLQAEINKMNNKVRQDQDGPLTQKHYYLSI